MTQGGFCFGANGAGPARALRWRERGKPRARFILARTGQAPRAPRRLAQLSLLEEKSEHNQGRLPKSLHYKTGNLDERTILAREMRGESVYSRKQSRERYLVYTTAVSGMRAIDSTRLFAPRTNENRCFGARVEKVGLTVLFAPARHHLYRRAAHR